MVCEEGENAKVRTGCRSHTWVCGKGLVDQMAFVHWAWQSCLQRKPVSDGEFQDLGLCFCPGLPLP